MGAAEEREMLRKSVGGRPKGSEGMNQAKRMGAEGKHRVEAVVHELSAH